MIVHKNTLYFFNICLDITGKIRTNQQHISAKINVKNRKCSCISVLIYFLLLFLNCDIITLSMSASGQKHT